MSKRGREKGQVHAKADRITTSLEDGRPRKWSTAGGRCKLLVWLKRGSDQSMTVIVLLVLGLHVGDPFVCSRHIAVIGCRRQWRNMAGGVGTLASVGDVDGMSKIMGPGE